MTCTISPNDIFISHNTVLKRRMFTGIHFHSDYEIYYLIDGNTNYFIGDEIFHIHPGSFVFIPKGVLHKTDSEDCMTNERFLININDSLLDDDIRKILRELCKERVVYIPKSEMSFFEDLIYKIENEYNSDNSFALTLVRHYISELFVLIYRKKTSYKPKPTESEQIIQDISEYISSDYREEITLKSLSAKFAMSESYLSRKFKSVCGIGLNEYITYVRISKAEALLKGGELSITDVAAQCGFNDSNYFSSVFKKLKGITPFKYSVMYRKK